MPSRRLLIAVAAVVAVLAAAGWYIAGDRAGDQPRRRPAPALAGELLEGGGYDLAAHRGEVVVVNFWASWCAPCRAEIGDLERTYQAVRARGVSFVGVNIRDPDRDKARAFVAGRASYPSVFDPAGRLSIGFADFGATTIPTTVVVDRQGRIAEVIRAPVRQDELQPVVERVAAEPATGAP